MHLRHVIAAAALGAVVIVGADVGRAETPLERGTYLMDGIVACGNCHTPKGPDFKALVDQELAGGFMIEARVFRAVASNITPDPETSIGAWTDKIRGGRPRGRRRRKRRRVQASGKEDRVKGERH